MCIRSVSFLIFIVFVQVSCSTKESPEELKKQIHAELSKHHGTFALAFKDITTEEEILLNEHELFHAASTMKTPVMVEVFKQAAEGKLSLADSTIIKNEFKSIVDSSLYSLTAKDDSDTLIYKHIGEKRPLSSLVYDMITMSSNLATNIVIELVDAKKVTQTLRDIGAKDIQVLRGVEDSKAYQAGLNNQVTAYDLMLVFEKIAKSEMINPESCEAMIDILLNQKFNDIIPAKLPKEIKVAHKTGWIKGVHHDSAIVFLPDGRKYVLVILSKNLDDEENAKASMALVSKMIYDFAIAD